MLSKPVWAVSNKSWPFPSSWLGLADFNSSAWVHPLRSVLSAEQGGWPVQTQMQRSFSGWWERSSFSGPNLTWVLSFCMNVVHFVSALILYVTVRFQFLSPPRCRTSNERSRTLLWWMRSITCRSSPPTARAKWARWVHERRKRRARGAGRASGVLRHNCTRFFLWTLVFFSRFCYFTNYFQPGINRHLLKYYHA